MERPDLFVNNYKWNSKILENSTVKILKKINIGQTGLDNEKKLPRPSLKIFLFLCIFCS